MQSDVVPFSTVPHQTSIWIAGLMAQCFSCFDADI